MFFLLISGFILFGLLSVHFGIQEEWFFFAIFLSLCLLCLATLILRNMKFKDETSPLAQTSLFLSDCSESCAKYSIIECACGGGNCLDCSP